MQTMTWSVQKPAETTRHDAEGYQVSVGYIAVFMVGFLLGYILCLKTAWAVAQATRIAYR